MRTYLILPWIVLLAVQLSPAVVYADTLDVEVQGVAENLVENVRAHIGSKWVSGASMSSQRRRARFRKQMETRAARALRPFGFYFPEIESSLRSNGQQSWLLKITIKPGEPVKVRQLQIEIKGDGRDFDVIRQWRADWSLGPGAQLDQVKWQAQKETVLNIAAEWGYLSAVFETSEIRLDLDQNVADLVLVLDTGPRAVMGDITYDQGIVRDSVLESIPRFNKGDYYRIWLVDTFRTDLWRSGYFDQIEVLEQRHLDQDPQRVDFKVTLKGRKKNTHQGTIGYGTDSQFRMQYRWQRHLLSQRGDSFGMGLGLQQRNEELLLSGEYRLPRQTRSFQYWSLGGALRTTVEDLELAFQDEGRQSQLLSGRVENFSARFGKAKLRDAGKSRERIVETMYLEYLIEKNDFTDPQLVSPLTREIVEQGDFNSTDHSISVGMEWDWPVILGQGFSTTGHHERGWVFTANDIWGSEREFTQAYLSSRWNFVFSDNWKLLLRAEAGYTDAKLNVIERELDGELVTVSVTELPFLYRFKAGGSRSVRGYGFETLSNNNIGSNHVFTASTEVEYQFRQDWSIAAFYDVGNAFNDWSDMDLKAGVGIGLRWYTIAGAIRIDVAQGLDIDGKPWEFHLTIGTPLL